MAADPRKAIEFDSSVVGQLACPVCIGALRVEDARLVCVSCGRAYPVVDGIPVLIAERAGGSPRSEPNSR
jgi:uncharacterized protein